MSGHSFPRKEKLKTRKEIEQTLKTGKFLSCKLLTMIYLECVDNERSFHKFAVSVPKKHIKKAVQRNRLKRQIREIYRLNKPCLQKGNHEVYCNIFLIYRCSEMYSFDEIKSAYLILRDKMSRKINL
ncbi:MAG: ribonuclease P protein component [Bacteroidia bacterium]|nr:MAG: ribonuclease P protein component [Bacteroidia bacterium]